MHGTLVLWTPHPGAVMLRRLNLSKHVKYVVLPFTYMYVDLWGRLPHVCFGITHGHVRGRNDMQIHMPHQDRSFARDLDVKERGGFRITLLIGWLD